MLHSRDWPLYISSSAAPPLSDSNAQANVDRDIEYKQEIVLAVGPPSQCGQKRTGKKGTRKESPGVKKKLIAPVPLEPLGLEYAPPAELVVILLQLVKTNGVVRLRS